MQAPGGLRQVGGALGGEAHVYYAPLILSDAAGAAVIRAHPDVVEAHRRIADVTIALVSIGAWAPGQSTIHDAVDESTRERLSADGVVGEVVGVCFDAEGALVEPGLTDRLVAVTAAELRGIDRVVALASRAQRAGATAACLRSGLVDVLVVDRSLARRLLDPRLRRRTGAAVVMTAAPARVCCQAVLRRAGPCPGRS